MNGRSFTLCAALTFIVASLCAQTAESFFPHHVGDRWEYWHSAWGYSSIVLTRDSIATDGSHYLFYGGSRTPSFKIDTMQRVIFDPTWPRATVWYQLRADSGFVWQGGPWRWAWVGKVESVWVLGRRTVSKVFRYNPAHPDTTGWNRYYEEHRLASGFGKSYWEGEPAWVEILRGCIIAGDTFGVLTSVRSVHASQMPDQYRIKQNYPNPFNPITRIEFDLPEAANVTLRVLDILGREVDVLVNAKMNAGTYQAEWNGSHAASGVYICRLEANGLGRSIKIMLSK